MNSYTVNTSGKNVEIAENRGYHAYYASGVTAIEVKAKNMEDARKIVESMGLTVLFIFE